MVFVLVIGIGCGFATGAILYPLGLFTAALVAPIGGSAGALLAGLLLARSGEREWQSQDDLDEQTDAMVAAFTAHQNALPTWETYP